jgi:hypothetical protein
MKKILLLFLALISFGVTNISAKRCYIDVMILPTRISQPSYMALVDQGNNMLKSFAYLYDNDQYGSYFFTPMAVCNLMANNGWVLSQYIQTNLPTEAAGIFDVFLGKRETDITKIEHYIFYKDSLSEDNESLYGLKLTDKLVKPQKTEKEKAYEKKHEKIREQGDGVYQ